ncbi:Uncharacterized [Syntrophomonas zehnderi OL-4]|uniref:Uncharacterized n=1 Tax=Syntrophomonas zehnderi OL-4 TaxID=690567 RepID=A0A0E4GCH4_9FIRM|nr:hypothetical protein [Syntrophomonas zehnderi]CFX97490.1 Uncharacterized [Syntrophomonas zehnderi OL-4]
MQYKVTTRLVIISAVFIFIVYLSIFINSYPRITIIYNDNEYSQASLQAIKNIENLKWGEICDPLPCWLQLKVQSVTSLEKDEIMQDNAPIPVQRTRQIPAIELISDGNVNEGPLVSCPRHSYLVTVLIMQPSWSRLFSSNYALNGSRIKFCVNTNK